MRLKNLISRNILFKKNSIKYFSNKSSPNDLLFPDRSIDYFLSPNKYAYIDKTKFIEKVISNNNTEIYHQPDSFGKTFNLEILRYFLSDLNKIDNVIDKSKRKQFFEKTEIFNNKELVEKHFQKHPIIYLNFKELDERNFEDNIEKLKLLINTQIDQIFQYENAKNLTSFELKIFEEFISNMRNVSHQLLVNMPKELSRVLAKLSENNPFILINNYDYPLIHSYGRKCYEDFEPFLESFIKNTFKNNNYIYKGILTGVNELEHVSIFSSLNNLKLHSYKSNEDVKTNAYFGVNVNEDNIANGNNLKGYSNTIPIFTNNNITTNTVSYVDFYKCLEKTNLRSLDEESLIKSFNIERISEYLNLDSLFGNMVNDSSKDYLSGYKLLNILNKKAEDFINDFYSNSNHNVNADYDLNHNFNLANNIFFSFKNPLQSFALLSYLLSNNIISYNHNANSMEIPNIKSALLIKTTFAKQKFHLEDYDRKLAYNFYRYLYFNKVPEYFQEIKSIFEAIQKNAANKKISPFNKQVNLNFKSEKELENYFVHIMTLELNNENSKENLNIFAVEDYDNNKVSDLLKEFTLITFDDKKFAIFIKFNKHKLSVTSPSNEELNEIDEVHKNDIIKKSKKRIPKVDYNELTNTLKNINEENLSNIDQEEAVRFLKHISNIFESVSFVSVSNYKNYLEFSTISFLINEKK